MVRIAHALGTRRRRLTAVAVVVAAVAVTWWYVGRSDADEAQTSTATAEVTASTVEDTVSGSGTLEAQRSSELSFSSSGTVTRVYVQEGDEVTKGDRLARIDTTELQATLASARAQLDAAETTAADDGNASSAQQAANTAAVASAEADVAEARKAVKDAVLTAPFSGMVAEVGLEEGDHVGSGATSGSGSSGTSAGATGPGGSGATSSTSSTDAITVITPTSFVVTADVSAGDVERIKDGMQARITPTGSTDTVFGTVQTVGKVAETGTDGTASFPVTIALTGEQQNLYAGTSADVSIVVESREGVLTVPTAAIRSDGDQAYVEKVTGDGTTRTEVEIGDAFGMTTEVVSGLQEGDTVQYTQTTVRPGGSGGGQGGFPGGGGLPGGGEMPSFPGGGGFPSGGGFPGGGQ